MKDKLIKEFEDELDKETERRKFMQDTANDYQKQKEHLYDMVREAQSVTSNLLSNCNVLLEYTRVIERLYEHATNKETKEAYRNQLIGLNKAIEILRQ